jgi:hypothetical protein
LVNFVVHISIDNSNNSIYKAVEVKNSNNTVHFYEYDVDAFPVMNGQDQASFTPGDLLFEEKIFFLINAMMQHEMNIVSQISEFSFQIYGKAYSDLKVVFQVCFDGGSPLNYRTYIHHGLTQPFSINDLIGTFSLITFTSQNYSGYKYSPFQQGFNQSAVSGLISSSGIAEIAKNPTLINGRTEWKIEGTTSKGKRVKVEDKGDGEGPKTYEWNEDTEEWDPVDDPEEIEEIWNDICDDLENGLGDYEIEAYSYDNSTTPPTKTPVDLIVWRKNSDGTYSGIRALRNGLGGWDTDGKTGISRQEMCQMGYIPCQGDDPNPDGAWFVGRKLPSQGRWEFEKYHNGKPYYFEFGPGPGVVYLDPSKPGVIFFIIRDPNAWPSP